MRCLSRLLVLASVSSACLFAPASLHANPPVDLFGGILNQMIQQDMQRRQQHEEERRQREEVAVAVRRLQAALQRLGYYSGSIDGDYGTGTQAALAAYQRDRGLPITSDLTPYDLAEIEAAARNQASAPPSPPTPVPTAEDEGEDMPAVEYTAVTPEAAWKDYRFTQAHLSQPGPYKPPGDAGWLTVASAVDFQGVVGAAINYAQDYPGTAIIKSNNGRFAITIGWLPKAQGKKLLEALKSEGVVPSDAYVSSGQRYIGPVWTTSAAVNSRNDLLRQGSFRASPQLWNRMLNGGGQSGFGDFRSRVAGVTSSDGDKAYLSLRKSADVSGEEVTRMPEGTLLAISETSGGWSRVRLLDGREGWASNKYIVLNDDALEGRSPAPSQPETDTPYGDKDLQDKLVEDGGRLLRDISLFLRSNPNVPGITEIAEAVSQLNTAMPARDYPTIESATAKLQELLAKNEAYKLFETQQDDKRKQDAERQKAEAIALANRNIYFLKSYIPANVTAPAIGDLAGLLKEYEAAIRFPVRETLEAINQRLAATLEKNSLSSNYTSLLQGYVAAPATAENKAQAAPVDKSAEDREQLKAQAEKAAELLDLVNRFSGTGKKVADPIQAARLIVNLKASIRAADAVAIMRDQKALAEFLAKDTAFAAFEAQERETTALKELQQKDAATLEAKRLVAFIDDYINHNFASDKLEVLIAAQDKLRAALQGGNGPDLFSTVSAAQQMIANAGLKMDMDAYRLADTAVDNPALVKCRSIAKLSSWADALPVCEAAQKELPGNAEIAALLETLLQQQRNAGEIDLARKKATALLDQLRSFAEAKRTLTDPLGVARLANDLRGTVEGSDAPRILAADQALEQALAKDPGFRDFEQAQQKGQNGLNDELLKEQSADAKNIRAFIADYVARHVAEATVGKLLGADAALEAALASADGNQLLTANEAARGIIAELGADEELEKFSPPPQPAEASRKKALETLATLDAFARDGKTLGDPLKAAALVANLRRSLDGQDGAAIDAAETALIAGLSVEKAFTEFSAKYAEAAQREALDRLAELKNEAQRIDAFIKQLVSGNVSSPEVPRLLDLATALDGAIASDDAQRLQDAAKAAGEALSELKLGQQLAAFTLAPQQPQPKLEATSNELYVDEKNRELLSGGGGDVLVLFNNSGKARGVRRDLLGRLVFSDPVSLCWYHDQPKPDLGARMAFADLLRQGAGTISVTGVCRAEDLPSADLVMLRRAAFLATDRAYAKALVDQFTGGTFEIVTVVKGDTASERETADQRNASEIAQDIQAGRRSGYGVIRFAPEGGVLCLTPGPHHEALSEALQGMLHPLAGELAGWALTTVASTDAAFAEARKGSCGALVLPREAMAQVVTAAQRDKVPFEILPFWLEEKQAAEAQSRIDADKAARAQAEEIRKRQIDDAAKEEAIRREKLGEVKAEQEKALREQYESLAEGLAADAGDQLRDFVDAPEAAETAEIARVFPTFAGWYRDQVNGGWELQSDGFTTALADYGTVQWEGRTLDTVFFQITIGMNHRDLGKYQSSCFLLGLVTDKEFRRYRDVFEKPCAEANPALEAWEVARKFESRWIIK